MSLAAVLRVIDGLDSRSVPYMLVGSFSTNFYGIPRSTQDADFVVELGDTASSRLTTAFGAEFKMDPQMSFETVTGTSRFILELKDSPFKIELFLLSGDAHDQERFRRRRQVDAFGRRVWIAAVEDVVITKLRWSLHGKRTKDVEDVRSVLARQAGSVDWAYVDRWCAEHGTSGILKQVCDALPPLPGRC